MARRGENIYKRKDGRYEGRYIKGRKPDGKPRFGYVYSRKYSDVQTKLNAYKVKYKDRRKRRGEIYHGVFSEYFNSWLLKIEDEIKPSTLAGYRRNAEKHIFPALGDKPTNKIKPKDLPVFTETLKMKKLSVGTQRNILLLLLTVIKYAIKKGDMDEEMIVNFVLPAPEKKQVSGLTRGEQKAIENIAVKSDKGIAVMIALYTGMRLGEICALRWDDVDLSEGLIHVRRTVQRLASGLYVGKPKTEKSMRIIPMPDELLSYLRRFRNGVGVTSEYIISKSGRISDPRTIQYQFQKILKSAGVRHVKFHIQRHTYAIRCLELKVDIVTLSQLLGHTSAKMTLDVYGDSLIEHKKQEVQALNLLYAEASA